MRIGICRSVDNAAVVKAAGFEYIEEGVQRLLVPESPDEEYAPKRDAASGCGLPVEAACGLLPGNLKCVGPEVDTERFRKYIDAALARASEVGITRIVFGSGGARKVPDGFAKDEAADQFVERLGEMAPVAEKAGVTVVVEPLNSTECNFINSLAEGAELVRRADHPNIRLLADIYHMLMDGEGPEAITAHADIIAHCHVAEKEGRRAPGTAPEDLRPYLRALVDAGYNGGISVECRWEDLAAEAEGAVKALRAQIAEVGG